MSTANNSVNSQYSASQPTWLLVLIVSTSIFATTIITPSLPGITLVFSVTAQQTQMVITGFLAATAVGQLFFGPFSDRFGRRKPLLAGLGLYLAGSILAFMATDLSVLVLARCVQGVGAAAAMVLSRVIINDTHAPRAAAASMAAVMSATALAPILAFSLGGVLYDAFGWQGGIGVTVLLGTVAFILALIILGETHRSRQSRLSLESVTLNYVGLLHNKQFLLFAGNLGFQASIFFALLSFLPFAFHRLGYSAAAFGFFVTALPVGFLTGSGVSRKLTPLWGIPRMVRMGSSLSILATGSMTVLAFVGYRSVWALLLPAMLFAFSNGLVVANSTMGAVNAAHRSVAGFASGLAGSFQLAFASLVAWLTIFLGAAEDVRIGIAVVFMMALVGTALAFLIPLDSGDSTP